MRFFCFLGFYKMNILIVGNGFDLSHYLPTKYDHFMLVMKAIEKKDLNKPINDVLYSPFEHPIHLITKYFKITHALDQKSYQMNFEQLFSALLHKDLKCKAPLIELNLRRNLGKWST